MSLLPVIAADALSEGKTAVFTFRDPVAGFMSEGFVIRYGGVVYAYRNLCRHQPLTLDYGDGEFLTEDGRYLLCRNHGALFEPDSGLCISGPCLNAFLHRFDVVEENGQILVRLPDPDAFELE